jgi:hypothetical protein
MAAITGNANQMTASTGRKLQRIYVAMETEGIKSYWEPCKKSDFKVFEYIEGIAKGTIIGIDGNLYRLKCEKHG